MLAVNGKESQTRTFAKCMNEVQLAPDAQMWIDTKRALPVNGDEMVLVIVNGRPSLKIEFRDAYQLATYADGEGWIIGGYEEWEGAEVSWWMPLPEPPEGAKDA